MSDSKKYYTPRLEEFHNGFEYEYQNEIDATYEPKIFKSFSEKELHEWVNICIDMPDVTAPTFYRVKHIDKRDIIKLGFTYLENMNHYAFSPNKEMVHKKGYRYFLYLKDDLIIIRDRIYNSNEILFKGVLKNISELRRLLNQIGINE